MRFSILLPTRNGGPYLPDCLDAVLSQDGEDFQVVVADNANHDETSEVLLDYAADPRVTVVRSDVPLSVAENWNRALDASTGDYLAMIGDDDLLMPSYLSTLREAVRDDPDCVTYNAFSFVAPSSIDDSEVARFSSRHFKFGPDFVSGSELDASMRYRLVEDMFRFRPRLPLNMQTTLFSRRMTHRLKSPFFRPPFPDHIALCGMLVKAKRWRFLDESLVVIGVSPKSFGHYVYTGNENDGLGYLGVETDFPGSLPGNELINGMHRWLEVVAADHRDELSTLSISRSDYVARQMWSWYAAYRAHALSGTGLARRIGLLTLSDWVGLIGLVFDWEFVRLAWKRVRHQFGVGLLWPDLRPVPGVETIAEFVEWLGRSFTEEHVA